MSVKQLITELLEKETLAVISTVSSNNTPQAAVVEFGQTDKLELIFDTFSGSRKYQNLLHNNQVAVVIGWDNNVTVQYEGLATELAGDELAQYKSIYFQKNPDAKRWDKYPDIKHFKITPTWIRYSDLSHKPWTVLELDSF